MDRRAAVVLSVLVVAAAAGWCLIVGISIDTFDAQFPAAASDRSPGQTPPASYHGPPRTR